MRHTILVTLTKYITSEMDAGLKRKMFGMLDKGDLGQLTELRKAEMRQANDGKSCLVNTHPNMVFRHVSFFPNLFVIQRQPFLLPLACLQHTPIPFGQ